jgi:hypothetical protein
MFKEINKVAPSSLIHSAKTKSAEIKSNQVSCIPKQDKKGMRKTKEDKESDKDNHIKSSEILQEGETPLKKDFDHDTLSHLTHPSTGKTRSRTFGSIRSHFDVNNIKGGASNELIESPLSNLIRKDSLFLSLNHPDQRRISVNSEIENKTFERQRNVLKSPKIMPDNSQSPRKRPSLENDVILEKLEGEENQAIKKNVELALKNTLRGKAVLIARNVMLRIKINNLFHIKTKKEEEISPVDDKDKKSGNVSEREKIIQKKFSVDIKNKTNEEEKESEIVREQLRYPRSPHNLIKLSENTGRSRRKSSEIKLF